MPPARETWPPSTRLLDAGLDVNAKGRYGTTALFVAADKGSWPWSTCFSPAGPTSTSATPSTRPAPLSWAVQRDHAEIARRLVEKGAAEPESALELAVKEKDEALARAVLARGPLRAPDRVMSLAAARGRRGHGHRRPPGEAASRSRSPRCTMAGEALGLLAGEYAGEGEARDQGRDARRTARGPDSPRARPGARPRSPIGDNRFRVADKVEIVDAVRRPRRKHRVGRHAGGCTSSRSSDELAPRPMRPSRRRGADRPLRAWSSRADAGERRSLAVLPRRERLGDRRRPGRALELGRGQGLERALEDRPSGPGQLEPDRVGRARLPHDGRRARRAIPRSARASTATWTPCPRRDRSPGTSCASTRRRAELLWDRVAHEGAPRVKRHTKSTYANPTPATDGRYVVAQFGSEGLFAFDMDGRLLWKKDLGVLDSGWFYDPTYQWGFSSSPVIYGDSRDRAGRHPEGLVHRRLGPRHRPGAVADAARGDLDLGHAHRPARARRATRS